MTFVHDTGEERATPPTEGELPDGRTVSGITPDNLAMAVACGWHPVTDTPRPDDTDTTTHDRTVTNIDGTWTVTWTKRDLTADEMAPPEPDRVAVLEAQNAALLADLSKATTLAQIRAAATKAADL
jgi:hypothetical protein